MTNLKLKTCVWEEDQHTKPCQNVLDKWSTAGRVGPDLLKAVAVELLLTDTKSAVSREDLKPFWESEKMSHLLR